MVFQQCTWFFTKIMETCELGALSREAELAHAPHQQAAPLPDQWCMKLWPGCNRHIHLMVQTLQIQINNKYNNWCKASNLIAPALTNISSQIFKMGSWKKPIKKKKKKNSNA